MGVIDLDAARAAREELYTGSHVLRFGGQEFLLPNELPWEFSEELRENNVRATLNVILGEHADAFWATKPTIEDATELVKGLAREYGFGDVGESPASNGSSPSTSNRSRPTSPASTG